jgi:hypothetical protein
MTEATTERIRLTADEAISRLDIWTENCEACQNELSDNGYVENSHVNHGPRRRIVHSMTGGGLGADWDADAAIEFIRAADVIVETSGPMLGIHHGVAARGIIGDGPKWRAFATKDHLTPKS